MGLSDFLSGGSGDDVRSAWPLCPGQHTYYNGAEQWVAKPQGGANPNKRLLQWGLKAATRLHERGIGSNRGSACRGEYVLKSCTHRPSN